MATNALKDAVQLSKEMDQMNMSDTFIVSFDMPSLFTNIPLEESIHIICD